MRATIKDIAAATGFSVTTISLVLNGKGYKISDETKNQILAKARELNYRPNQLAVSLVKRQEQDHRIYRPGYFQCIFCQYGACDR